MVLWTEMGDGNWLIYNTQMWDFSNRKIWMCHQIGMPQNYRPTMGMFEVQQRSEPYPNGVFHQNHLVSRSAG